MERFGEEGDGWNETGILEDRQGAHGEGSHGRKQVAVPP